MPLDQRPDVAAPRRSVVIGGGVAGLVAARELAARGDRVLLLEAASQVGGKLRLAEVAGVPVDVGAEAMLNRRPEGVTLARELGLPVIHPAVLGSRILARGALCPLPRSLMGVPLDVEELGASGVLSGAGLARARAEREVPPDAQAGDPAADPTIGELVDRRFGPEVTDRLVDPLLGGVYAGDARAISGRAALPRLVEMAARGSVLAQAGDVLPSYDGRAPEPVFAGVEGGLGRLPQALVDQGRFEVRTGATVRELRRTPGGWRLLVGPTTAAETVSAERVVLAVPPHAAARLLADAAPAAAAELGAVETASLAVVTLAVRASEAAALEGRGSGFLVPAVEQRAIKAATLSFAKWAWVRAAGSGAGPAGEDLLFLRTSLGRAGEVASLQADDAELVARSLADLAAITGLRARPVDAQVQRWGGGLPQYARGHVERVARVRAAAAAQSGLAVCGAAYDGVGVPAVIASARRAVADLG